MFPVLTSLALLCGTSPAVVPASVAPSRGYLTLLCGSALPFPTSAVPTVLTAQVLTLPGSIDPAWSTVRSL